MNDSDAVVPDPADSPLAIYRAHLREGRLAYQFDSVTGRAVFPPRLVGPGSGNTRLEWRISQGRGTVHATTMVHVRGEPPYNVALVDLDEGFRMMARVEPPAGGTVRIGQRVAFRTAETDGPAPRVDFEVLP